MPATQPALGMVDITSKPESFREAVAEGYIRLRKNTIEALRKGWREKGDLETIASIAAILAAKKLPEIIPHTHNIPLTSIKTKLEFVDDRTIRAMVIVRTHAKTGVEMEALAAVMAALLAVWDVVKKLEKDEKGQYPETTIYGVRVLSKIKEG
ncbi:MAG: cyclic pyranopterin monophosphate synthase MoaC [Pyrodictiaceae archaeon]